MIVLQFVGYINNVYFKLHKHNVKLVSVGHSKKERELKNKTFYSFKKWGQIEVIRIGDSWYNIACVLDYQEGLLVWIMEVGIMQEQGSGIKKNFGEKIWKMGLFD